MASTIVTSRGSSYKATTEPPDNYSNNSSGSSNGIAHSSYSSSSSSSPSTVQQHQDHQDQLRGGRDGGIETDDNKYGKYRRQKRMKSTLTYLVFAVSLLGFTIWNVGSRSNTTTNSENGIGDDSKMNHDLHAQRKRDQDARRRKNQKWKTEKEEERDDRVDSHRVVNKRWRNKLKHQEFPRGGSDNDDDESSSEEDDNNSKEGKVNAVYSWFQRGGGEGEEEEAEKLRVDALEEDLTELDKRMNSNKDQHIKWIDMSDVPPLHPNSKEGRKRRDLVGGGKGLRVIHPGHNKQGSFKNFFQVHRPNKEKMVWEEEFDTIVNSDPTARSTYVDYTKHQYRYPKKLFDPPDRLGEYPKLRTYGELYKTWPQDAIDDPPDIIQEDLIHFDYNDPNDMKAALKFRTDRLPFKLINVPELIAANNKWTDEYISQQFDTKKANGRANETPNNFFAFFNEPIWDVIKQGVPPSRNNDWTYKKWSKHARYADRVGLDANLPHFYWQSGVPAEERRQPDDTWSFVSKDLPSWSSSESNFIVFQVESQKGIQCRFGERGITAAAHYDSGRNMVGMITGAKRYILSPPRACPNLGIVTSRGHPSFRHSMLNFGHISHLKRDDMPHEEREWMEIASGAEAVSTVLKSGEVLYIPTGWFHYITSLQKSAQCNVRSGPDKDGDEVFGGAAEVNQLCIPPKPNSHHNRGGHY